LKRWIVLTCLLFAVSAGAVHPPQDPNDLAKIQALLNDGRKTQLEIDDLMSKRGKKASIQVTDAQQAVIDQQIDRDIESRKNRQKEIYERAVHKTLTAYGIVPAGNNGLPDMPAATDVMPDYDHGKQVTWLVQVDEKKGRYAVDSQGNTHWIAPPPEKKDDKPFEPLGRTNTDGVTTLYLDKLGDGQVTPAKLAGLLLHEKTHFELFTTPGQGNNLSADQREVKALEAERNSLGDLGLDAMAKERYSSGLDTLLDEANQKVNLGNTLLGKFKNWELRSVGDDYREEELTSPHTQAELAEIKGHAELLRDQMAAEIAQERQDKRNKEIEADVAWTAARYNEQHFEKELADAKAAQDRANSAVDTVTPMLRAHRAADSAALRNLYQNLSGILDALCSDPGDAWDQYDDFCRDETLARGIESKYNTNRQAVPEEWSDDIKMTRCGTDFWNDFLSNRTSMCYGPDSEAETANATWFQNRARAYHQQYYAPLPAPPPPAPRSNPKPMTRDPGESNGGCPPGWHYSGPGLCTRGRPANPL
jgi:hypothetical protein